MSKTLSLKPRLSEKTYALSESRIYVVEVPKGANKHLVARAVEQQFEVKVASVRIVRQAGKTKRVMSLSGKRYANSYGQRREIKKAYVTLKEGFSLPFFAAVEEEQKKEQASQEKIDTAMSKQSAKEAKKETRRGLIKRRRPAKETSDAN